MQTEELQTKIGKKIKELRNVNQWTQEQVAGQLHLTRNAYSDIELGKTDICISRLAQIANFFGVDIGYLVDDKERVVFYLSGTQNIQSIHKNQFLKFRECHVYSGAEKYQHELEKAQLTITHLQQQIEDKQKIIAVLEMQSFTPT